MTEPHTPKHHWARKKERGSFILMRFTALMARRLGRRILAPLLYMIVLYFYASDRRGRASIRQYQRCLAT